MSKCSFHLCQERTDRAVFILTTLGMGEPVRERQSTRAANVVLRLTTTGVILVYNTSASKIITMYYATMKEASWVANGKMPDAVYNRIVKNVKAGYITQQERIKY